MSLFCLPTGYTLNLADIQNMQHLYLAIQELTKFYYSTIWIEKSISEHFILNTIHQTQRNFYISLRCNTTCILWIMGRIAFINSKYSVSKLTIDKSIKNRKLLKVRLSLQKAFLNTTNFLCIIRVSQNSSSLLPYLNSNY